jgi:hypothetical protein
VLAGENNAGKSNVIDAMEVMLADELMAEPDSETRALKNQLLTKGVEGSGEPAAS